MRVLVNGVRLFFDVEGASLVPEGATMREKPTLVLLQGGPGLDHSIYKPSFSALADVAQRSTWQAVPARPTASRRASVSGVATRVRARTLA